MPPRLDLADLTVEEHGERLRFTIAEYQRTAHLTVVGAGLLAGYLLAWLEEQTSGPEPTTQSWVLDVPLRHLLHEGIGRALRATRHAEEPR